MMNISCTVQYNEESSQPPHQDNGWWRGRPKIRRQTTILLVSVVLLFAFHTDQTARIADGIMAATSSSTGVARTAIGASVGGMRPLRSNDGLTTDKIKLLAVHLLLACGLMEMVAVIFRCTFARPRASLVLCLPNVCSLGELRVVRN